MAGITKISITIYSFVHLLEIFRMLKVRNFNNLKESVLVVHILPLTYFYWPTVILMVITTLGQIQQIVCPYPWSQNFQYIMVGYVVFFFFYNMSIQGFAPINPMDTCSPPVPYTLGDYQTQWHWEWLQRDLLSWGIKLATYISWGAYYSFFYH